MIDFEKGEGILLNAEEYSGLPHRRKSDVILRIWSFPALAPCRSWTVFNEKGNYFLRRIVWDQRSKKQFVDPLTFGTEKQISSNIIEPLLNELSQIEIPIFKPVSTIGIDGVNSGVEYGGYNASAKLSWWCDPPESWETLQNWHAKAMAQFDNFLPVSSADL